MGATAELSPRERAFRRHLKTLKPGRLLDLATGHGKFAVIARDLGWKVTAVDVRDVRFPDEKGIDWVVGDVRTFDVSGYDVIANLGLLYHLDLDSILDLLKRCAPTPMILDTHISLKPKLRDQGYAGHIYEEPAEEEERHATPTAAWDNPTAYWLTEEALIMALRDSGYIDIYVHTPHYRHNRSWYWCV